MEEIIQHKEDNNKIIVRIDFNKNNPVPFDSFIKHLTGLDDQYCKFTNKKDKLLIVEVRECCIEIELLNTAMSLITGLNNVTLFYNNLKQAFNYLKTKKGEKHKMDKTDLNNCKNILQIGEYANVTINGNVNFAGDGISFDRNDVPTMNKNADEYSKELEEQKKTNAEFYENVYLRIIQARTDDASTKNKRTTGVIKNISDKELTVTFAEGIREEIISYPHPNFTNFLVNVRYDMEPESYFVENFWGEVIEDEKLFLQLE